MDLWLGSFAPSSVPATLVARLNAEIGKALENQVVRAALAKAGVEPRIAGVDDSARFVRAESEKWANVVRDAHLKEGR